MFNYQMSELFYNIFAQAELARRPAGAPTVPVLKNEATVAD